jgi:hypothetical protein
MNAPPTPPPPRHPATRPQESGKSTSVAAYFAEKGTKLRYPGLECVDVGAAGRPIYIPPELCTWARWAGLLAPAGLLGWRPAGLAACWAGGLLGWRPAGLAACRAGGLLGWRPADRQGNPVQI